MSFFKNLNLPFLSKLWFKCTQMPRIMFEQEVNLGILEKMWNDKNNGMTWELDMMMGGLSKRLEHEHLLHICSLNVFIIHLMMHLAIFVVHPSCPVIHQLLLLQFFSPLVVISTSSSLFVQHATKNNSIPMPLTLPCCPLTWCIPIVVPCQ